MPIAVRYTPSEPCERSSGAPAAQQHPLGVVAAGHRLDHRRRVGRQAGDQDARLDLCAGHRQLVLDPGSRAPWTVNGGKRRSGPRSSPPSAAAARRSGRRPPPDRVVAVEHEARPGLERQPARQQPHQRAGVADVDRAPPAAARCAARRRGSAARRRGPRRSRRARGRRPGSSWCPRRRGSCGSGPARRPSRRPARRGARSTCRRAARSAPQRARGREARVHARATGNPSVADQLLGPARRFLAGDPQRDDALAHVGRGIQRHVGDVDAGAPELERQLRDHPGTVRYRHAQLEQRAAGELGLEQRAGGRRRPASFQAVIAVRIARGERVADARPGARSCRRARPPAHRGWTGRCRSRSRSGRRPRGWRRGSSDRSPAAARRRTASVCAACATSTLASTCGRCETVARIVSWVSASIAAGRAPSPRSSRYRRS